MRTARHSHIPLKTIKELAFVCLTHDRGLRFRDVISALRYGGRESYRHVRFVIHMLRNLMTRWRGNVKEQGMFSPDKIFTASKANRRDLWSFVALAKILVGTRNRSHQKWLRVDRFFGESNKTSRRANRPKHPQFSAFPRRTVQLLDGNPTS